MTKLISQNENGVIYVESDDGVVFGIVSSLKVVDEDGLSLEGDAFNVLEGAGFELIQDWENESTYIEFIEENGESPRVVFSGDNVSIADMNA